MLNRRRLTIASLLVAIVSIFFLPPVYWRVVGFVKGEAFYDGRPTSWWAKKIQERYNATYQKFYQPQRPPPQPGDQFDSEILGAAWSGEESQTWLQGLLENFRTQVVLYNVPLTNGDGASLPVLLELLRENDPRARWIALCGLAELENSDESILLAIDKACDDADPLVRTMARQARNSIQFP